MTPERYRQIGELYHAALEVEADERAALLDRACAGDAELRREVESLIASHNQAADFIAAPALMVAAGLLAESEADALTGRMIARYRVLSLLGAGGMGRVYLAEDTGLGRRVALKLLPEYFTNNKNQVQRFRQEAHAASALNHPNILTVYEVGQVDGTEFIAAEYVEGETLREQLTRAPFGVPETLDVAAQVADALVAAHATGVVHRDIKPENIMLRRDGYVKVLDFGLAKLTENLPGLRPIEFKTPTRPPVSTNPGVVMGTAGYMSPEQARGLVVDARTDVWSLGVMLYEMLAGRRPFEGATHGDTVVSILDREPAPLVRHMPEALPELERIVTKALAKDREKRYQTIKDMAIDLRRLRHQLEVEAELKRSAQPALSSAGTTVGSSGGQRAAAETATQSAARVTSSVGYFISKVNRHKKGAALVGVLVAIALVGLGDGLYRFFDWNIPAAQPSNSFEKVSLTKLTTSGKTIKAAISPDGNFIAHVLRQDGLQSLWVRQLSTASSLQLVPPAAIYYLGLAFSPDGSYVYYVKAGRSDEALGGLYQVSVLGGAERRLNIEVSGPVAPSPDGKQLAFAYHPDLESELMVANTDGSGQRKLAALDRPSFFGPPAWSPDGEKIVCPVFIMKSAEEGGSFMKVVAFRVKSGTEETLTPQNWVWIDKVAWLPGGGLIMIASDNTSSPLQVWHLSYPGGEVRKITNDLNNYTGVSVSASGDRIVAVQDDLSSNIWIAPRGDAARARQVTSGNYDGYDGLAWTPDGKIVYTSVLNGNHNLWMMEADGTTPKQLTTGAGQDYLPSVSPDGRYIVFVSRRTGTRNVWRMDIDGNDPKRLTDGDTLCPQFLPDSKWVLYASFDSRTATLCKVSIDGGAPVQLTDRDSRAALISKDSRVVSLSPGGKQIAYIVPDRTIEVISFDRFDRMRLIKRFHFPATASKELGWMPDGSAVAFVDTKDGVSNIWIRPLDSRKAIQLTDFKTERIFAFDWSRDGKQLLLSRGTVNNDVVLISETK